MARLIRWQLQWQLRQYCWHWQFLVAADKQGLHRCVLLRQRPMLRQQCWRRGLLHWRQSERQRRQFELLGWLQYEQRRQLRRRRHVLRRQLRRLVLVMPCRRRCRHRRVV